MEDDNTGDVPFATRVSIAVAIAAVPTLFLCIAIAYESSPAAYITALLSFFSYFACWKFWNHTATKQNVIWLENFSVKLKTQEEGAPERQEEEKDCEVGQEQKEEPESSTEEEEPDSDFLVRVLVVFVLIAIVGIGIFIGHYVSAR